MSEQDFSFSDSAERAYNLRLIHQLKVDLKTELYSKLKAVLKQLHQHRQFSASSATVLVADPYLSVNATHADSGFDEQPSTFIDSLLSIASNHSLLPSSVTTFDKTHYIWSLNNNCSSSASNATVGLDGGSSCAYNYFNSTSQVVPLNFSDTSATTDFSYYLYEQQIHFLTSELKFLSTADLNNRTQFLHLMLLIQW